MPVVTSYTEAELAQFMVDDLGELASALGWLAEDPRVGRAVNAALYGYHAGQPLTIAEATEIPRLEAHARLELWRAVARATAGYYGVTADGQTFNREQVHEHARAMAADAEREAGALGAGQTLTTIALIRDDATDPYAIHAEEESW